jgi:hypothetical protein
MCPRQNTRCREWNKFALTEFLFSDRVELSFRGQIKVALALCHGRREHEALQRVQWTVRPNTLQAGSEKLLLKTVPGKIQGRSRAQSFPDQGVDGISRSKGLRSRQRSRK